MPTVGEGATILVTGASGFIAAHAVDILLKRSFRVRGTVRTTEKGEYQKTLCEDAGGDRFEYVIVEDLQKDGGFDAAVKGVDGILHIASPLYRTVAPDVWANIIEPARKGTTSVLYAALKQNPDVKRIVITSSYASIANSDKPLGTVFTEDDWNTAATDFATEKGKELENFKFQAYAASKTWAEQAVWKFVEQEKPHFDVTTILAPSVTGPILNPLSSVPGMNTGNFEMWSFLTGAKDHLDDSAQYKPGMPIVDVRDVALAHIESLLCPEAGNRRIGVSNETRVFQEFLGLVRSHPDLAEKFPNAHWGTAGAKDKSPQYSMNGHLAEELIGLKYRSWEETALDSAWSLVRKGEEYGWDRTGMKK